MFRILLILSVSAFACACSSRVEYPPAWQPHSSEAININAASVDELEKLPRIGRKTAEAIVDFRNENGRFRRVENLLLIRGVSEARFAEIRDLVTVQ